MNDDDNYSDKIEEGGIDQQEEDSLTQTKKSIKMKSTRVKRKSSSKATKLPVPPPTRRSKSKNGKIEAWMNKNVFIK
jgi:hypothetical protein